MSDALQVEEGALAWLPAASVVAGEVIDAYNVPRAGLLHQAGHTYYFECIIGDGQEAGIWAYAPVSDAEVQELLAASGPEQIDALTPRFITDRWLTVAVALDDRIVESAVLDAGREGAAGLARRLMDRWERQRRARERAGDLVEALESV